MKELLAPRIRHTPLRVVQRFGPGRGGGALFRSSQWCSGTTPFADAQRSEREGLTSVPWAATVDQLPVTLSKLGRALELQFAL